jgi:hypothetical protein
MTPLEALMEALENRPRLFNSKVPPDLQLEEAVMIVEGLRNRSPVTQTAQAALAWWSIKGATEWETWSVAGILHAIAEEVLRNRAILVDGVDVEVLAHAAPSEDPRYEALRARGLDPRFWNTRPSRK